MTYANKIVLSIYDVQLPMTLLIFQNFCAVIILVGLRFTRLFPAEHVSLSTCQKWFPVTFLFVLFLLTGFQSLKMLTVPMVTVFKNLSNVLVFLGDWLYLGQSAAWGVVGSLLLMVLSAVVAGWTDLSYSSTGYLWMFANCVFGAGYVLVVRFRMQDTKLSDMDMALINNLLSIPVLITLTMLCTNEHLHFQAAYHLHSQQSGFLFWLITTGVIGTGLNLTAFFCLRYTSPTTYSMAGSLNKIPMVLVSLAIFRPPINAINMIGVLLGLASGCLYSIVKLRSQIQSRPPTASGPQREQA